MGLYQDICSNFLLKECTFINHLWGELSIWTLPESVSRMKSCSKSSPCSLRCKVSCQGRNSLGIVAWVVSKLDSDWLRRTLWDSSIELGDGSLRLYALVEADEANSLGDASPIGVLGAAWDVITQDAAGDDVATRGEHSLQIRLSHVLGQSRHVEICSLDGFTAGTSKGDLTQSTSLQTPGDYYYYYY